MLKDQGKTLLRPTRTLTYLHLLTYLLAYLLITYLPTYLLNYSMEQNTSGEIKRFSASQEIPHVL